MFIVACFVYLIYSVVHRFKTDQRLDNLERKKRNK